jgi:branched-chain amino acid transport system substrate-binding protein
MKREGTRRVFILNDGETYGSGLAQNVALDARRAGITVLANQRIDEKAANYRSLAQAVAARDGDSVFFGGITQNNAVQLWKDLNAAMPTAKLFGPDGVAESVFSGGIGSSAEKVTFVTNPTLDPKLYPPSGQEFFKDYKAKYGKDPEPYAIYGYEAMSVVLQAIQNAGDKGNDRQAVIDAFFQIKDRDSVLGKYSIDENGDTTLSDYGGNRVKGGKLVFDKVIKAQQ